MKVQKLKFKSKSKPYTVIIGDKTINVLSREIKFLCPKSIKIAIFLDKNVPKNIKKFLLKN